MSTQTQPVIQPGTWHVDAGHSSVEFQAKHMGIAAVKGFFGEFAGTVEVAEDPAGTRAWGTVRAETLNTRQNDRDTHLRSSDFLDTERFPEITFASKAIEPLDKENLRVTGDLTIRGVTQEIELAVQVQGADTDPWGNERVALEATGSLSRAAYGMTFNQALGSGNMLVGDKVKLLASISAVKEG